MRKEQVLANIEKDLAAVRYMVGNLTTQVGELKRADQAKSQPRKVQVSYLTDGPREVTELRGAWDYIDGIGDLKVGDRVWAPRRWYPGCEAIVVKLGGGQWNGPCLKITKRA